MKNYVSIFIIGLTISVASACYSGQAKSISYDASIAAIPPATILEEAEQKIEQAFSASIVQQQIEPLESVAEELMAHHKNSEDAWSTYWLAFCQYRMAIFQTILGEKEQSEATTTQALELLENWKEKTSEHYALQAMIRSFSIQFSSGIRAGMISQKVGAELKKAVKLDDQNLRAYYGLGSSDYYTPEQYGGGKKAEGYLTKAVELDAQYNANPIFPTWGKNEAYEMLVRFYMKKERFEDAKATFQKAVAEFPDDYQIAQLATQLVGK